MALSKFLDPKNDIAFRRIFGNEKNKDILIHFINDVLDLQGKDKIEEVTFQPTIQDPEIASKKQSVVDVLCKDGNGVHIIVEMQVGPQEGFEKRAQYYAAKAYSRQLNKGKQEGARYKDLKAVIFIAICNQLIFQNKKAYLSRHIILDKDTHSQDLKDFSFTFVELTKFKTRKIEELNSIIDKWCYFFKYAPTTQESDLLKIIGKDEMIERAYQELDQFGWSEEELAAYEREEKRIMDNQATEDYILQQGIQQGKAEGMQQGMEKGMKQGKAEGRQEGMQQGMEKEKIQIAKNMLVQGLDINLIQKITGLSLDTLKDLAG